jgi:hypothetical protein
MAEYITVFNTKSLYGVEKSGGIYYFKVILDDSHEFVKERLDYLEKKECERIMKADKFDSLPIMSNMRKMDNGTVILRIRIIVMRKRKIYKMKYDRNINKEDYLTGVDDLHIDSKIDVKFKVGTGYTFMANGSIHFGLNIYLDEIMLY